MAVSEASTFSTDSSSGESGSVDGDESSDVVDVADDVGSMDIGGAAKRLSSANPKMAAQEWNSDREYHESLVSNSTRATDRQCNLDQEEIRTTPLFSADVLASVNGTQSKVSPTPDILPQYSFLGKVLNIFGGHDQQNTDEIQTTDSEELGVTMNPNGQSKTKTGDSRLFVNMNSPWSAFICGSQGSGKSHTLSCMLEGALIPSRLGKLPCPLAAMVFHYDKFTGFKTSQICEAAYLCSTGTPVTVLVSSSNFHRMRRAYASMPGWPLHAPKPVVAPLLLDENHLNIEHILKLMAIDEKEGKISLYMESVCRILGSMAMKHQNNAGLNYQEFKDRLQLERFNESQRAMLHTRLQLLESFMYPSGVQGVEERNTQKRKWLNEDDARERAKIAKEGIWSFRPGSLTIVDLSCPFVDENTACAIFNICLSLFLEDRENAGRVVALDEAHKFMTGTVSSSAFTESLLSVIRQQRHLATRVIIATQEPTKFPSLLDLSSMTIVHGSTSPAWREALRSHLAAVSSRGEASKGSVQDIFNQIVELNTGQAFIFSSSAMLGVDKQNENRSPKMLKLGTQYIKVQVRDRTTADGGRSILAS